MINTKVNSGFLHISGLAGSRARYVDVLNPGGTKASGAVPAPSDLFAPLAPMPIPANVFVPNSGVWTGLWGGFMAVYGCVWLNPIWSVVPGESQPMEGSGAAEHTPAANQTNTDPAAAVEPEVGLKESLADRTQNSDSNPLTILSSSFTATVYKALCSCRVCGLTFYLKNRREMQVQIEVGDCIS